MDDIARHKKKAKHLTPKKIDHKHIKVKCIVEYNTVYGNKPLTIETN